LVIGKTRRNGSERDRKIEAVAGTHADRAIGSGLRPEVGAGWPARIVVAVAAKQVLQEVARSGRGVGILWPAIVLGERGQHRATLGFAFGAAEAAAAQP